MSVDLLDRILRRTMRTDQCWLWLGSRNTKGYGDIWVDGCSRMVHRAVYELTHGPIPPGLVIDHLCHDPQVCAGGRCVHRVCVNPDHLQAVTNAENLRRQSPAHKTHCIHGHERTPENTATASSGHKYCLPCRREQQSSYDRKSRPSLSEVRDWAREQGLRVGVRGRISRSVLEAYERRSA